MTALRDLLTEERIHHTFWCLNPNSGDTGGLLLDDWTSWDEEKYALLKPSLWQHGGKFVGLDHQVPLGGAGSTTGVSLDDVYGDGGGDRPTPRRPPPPPVSPPPPPAAPPWRSAGPRPPTTPRSPGYDVYRDGAKVSPAPVAATAYTDAGLTPGTAYRYAVRARDAAGNVSAASAAVTVTVTTPPGGDPSGTLGSSTGTTTDQPPTTPSARGCASPTPAADRSTWPP